METFSENHEFSNQGFTLRIIFTHYLESNVACQFLNMSKANLFKLVTENEITYQVINGKYYFAKRGLIDWMYRQNPRYVKPSMVDFGHRRN